jgi:hypothetical protein
MAINFDAVDEAVLALLQLSRYGPYDAWKGFDWDTLERLHQKGLIGNPVGKGKSLWMTHEGLAASESAFKKLFETPDSEAEAPK